MRRCSNQQWRRWVGAKVLKSTIEMGRCEGAQISNGGGGVVSKGLKSVIEEMGRCEGAQISNGGDG